MSIYNTCVHNIKCYLCLDFWTLTFALKFNIKLYKVTSNVVSPVDVQEVIEDIMSTFIQ